MAFDNLEQLASFPCNTLFWPIW